MSLVSFFSRAAETAGPRGLFAAAYSTVRRGAGPDRFSSVNETANAYLMPQSETAIEIEPGPERPDLVEKYLSLTNANRMERRKVRIQEVIDEFKKSEYDTGSTEVQIALLTEKINSVSRNHFMTHRKDHSSRRGFQAWLTRRRDLLQYLRKKDFDSYSKLLQRLGLRDTYFRTERLMKYRIGTGLKFHGGEDPLAAKE